jgi:hypothetical protein
VLRRIFGPKRNEDKSFPPNIVRMIKSRRMRWAGHVACMGERKHIYKGLVRRSEDKGPLGRPRRIWEDNINLDLRDIRDQCVELDLAGSG